MEEVNGKNPIPATKRPTKTLGPIRINTKMGKTLPFSPVARSVVLRNCVRKACVVGETLPWAKCSLDISGLFIIRHYTLRVAAGNKVSRLVIYLTIATYHS